MPLLDASVEDAEWVDDSEAPEVLVDLGANPWCSNCGDDLAGRGGILCPQCFSNIYAGTFTPPDRSPSLAQLALMGPDTNPGPFNSKGSLWTPDELQEEIAAEHRRQSEFAGDQRAARLAAAEGRAARKAGDAEDRRRAKGGAEAD